MNFPKPYIGTVTMNFVDTIGDANDRISNQYINGLYRLRQAGLLPIIISGIPYQIIYKALEQAERSSGIPLTDLPIGGSGGATAFWKHLGMKPYYSKYFQDPKAVKSLIQFCDTRGLRYQLFTLDGHRLIPKDYTDRMWQEMNKQRKAMGLRDGERLPPPYYEALERDLKFCYETEISPGQKITGIRDDQLITLNGKSTPLSQLKIVQMGSFTFDPEQQAALMEEMAKLGLEARSTGQLNYRQISPQDVTKENCLSVIKGILMQEGMLIPGGQHFVTGRSKDDVSTLKSAEKGCAYISRNDQASTDVSVAGAHEVSGFADQGALEAFEDMIRRVQTKPHLPNTPIKNTALLIPLDDLLTDQRLSNDTALALHKALERNIEVVLYTQIPYQHTRQLLEQAEKQHQVKLACHIVASSGAEVFNAKGQEIFQEYFDPHRAKEIVDVLFFHPNHLPFYVQTKNGLYFPPQFDGRFKYMNTNACLQGRRFFLDDKTINSISQQLDKFAPKRTFATSERFLQELTQNKETILRMVVLSVDPVLKESLINHREIKKMQLNTGELDAMSRNWTEKTEKLSG